VRPVSRATRSDDRHAAVVGVFLVAVELSHGQHGAGTPTNDGFGDAAEEVAVVAVAPAGAERDDVRVDFVGELGDLGCGATLANRGRDGAAGSLADVAEGLVGRSFERVGQFVAEFVGRGGDVALVDDVQRVDLGVEPLGEVERDVDGAGRALRAVGCDDHGVEHTRPVSGHVDKRPETNPAPRGRLRAVHTAWRPSVAFCPRLSDYRTMTLDIERVLVPVDASERAERAVEYAFALADRYGAAVHVLHVVDEPVARGLETGDVEAETVAEEQQSFLAETNALSPEVPVSHSTAIGFSRSRLRQHPGSAILDVAEELDADFIVVPREHATEPDETIGKSAQYVVEYASQPVLSV